MIWLTWRQFRAQAVAVSAALAAFAILLLVTGPHLVTLARQSGFGTCHSNCGTAAATFLNTLHADRPLQPGLHPGGRADHRAARRDRPVLGRAADRPRAGDRLVPAGLEPERHPGTLAGGQARHPRPDQHGARRAAQPHPRLVGESHRPRGRDRVNVRLREPLLPGALRRPRHRAHRLRGVRVHPRRAGRPHGPPHRAGHGHHAGRLRRGPDRHAGVDPPASHHAGAQHRPR